jgi:hypothetical protein
MFSNESTKKKWQIVKHYDGGQQYCVGIKFVIKIKIAGNAGVVVLLSL